MYSKICNNNKTAVECVMQNEEQVTTNYSYLETVSNHFSNHCLDIERYYCQDWKIRPLIIHVRFCRFESILCHAFRTHLDPLIQFDQVFKPFQRLKKPHSLRSKCCELTHRSRGSHKILRMKSFSRSPSQY